MTDMITRKTVLFAKKETTYATDPTVAGGDAMLCSNVQLTPLAGQVVNRDFYKDYIGASGAIHVGVHTMLTFDIEVAGGGAAGTAPAWGALLLGCGFAETINASTDATYDPVSASFDSVWLEVFKDGQQHILSGARGSFQVVFGKNAIPKLRFSFTGLYTAPATASPPTADFSAFQTPLPVSKTNTPTFSLHSGSAFRLIDLNLDMGNQVAHNDIVNEEIVLLTDRQGKGSIKMVADDLTTKNWFTTVKANTTGAMQIVHGTTAGNIVQIDAPAVQLTEPKYGSDQGRDTIEANLLLVPDSGNDELTIVVK